MKRIAISVLLIALALGFGTAVTGSAQGKDKSIEGTLVDNKCYFADPANKGNDHGPMKACGTACAKSGLPVGLLTADGKHLALVVAAPLVAEHIGQTVRATGTERGGSFVPAKLEVKKGSSWQEIKLSSMM